jgi:transmembrane sensor
MYKFDGVMENENYLLAKWLDNEMDDAELTEFKKSPDYHLYEKIKEYSGQIVTPKFDQDAVLSRIIATQKAPIKVIKFRKNWMLKIAASVVVLIGLSYLYLNFTTTSEIALNANKKTFQLPDNSEVVLNSGSEINYGKWNWNDNRKLNLKGEAYFKVAKGKTFEVETNIGKVSVLGTQFNVKARNNRLDVICYEGRVKVNYKGNEVLLTKGKGIAYENEVAIEILNNNQLEPKWLTNEIAFEKENIVNIISEINRQYNISIFLKNNTTKLFTGTIPSDDLETALQIIKKTYNLKSTRVNDSKIILTVINAEK